jgi:acyl-coenzyme A thioesterase PaaI-like protein
LLAAALDEAMSLAVHREALALTASIEAHLRARVPVGTYVQVSARVERREGRKRWASAELRDGEGALVAEGRALFVEPVEEG